MLIVLGGRFVVGQLGREEMGGDASKFQERVPATFKAIPTKKKESGRMIGDEGPKWKDPP